jgi:hypothetical protein
MGRIYTVPFTGTYTNAGGNTDLWALLAADDKPIKLRGFRLSQISEVGDAAEEGVAISIHKFSATVTNGSGGAAVTPVPMDTADAAAGFTARCNDTTVATTNGTDTVMEYVGWNERNTPCDFWYPDAQFCPKIKQGEGLIIRADTTIADDLTFYGTAWIEEE